MKTLDTLRFLHWRQVAGVVLIFISGCFAFGPPDGVECSNYDDIACPGGQLCVDFHCYAVCQTSDQCGANEACTRDTCLPYSASCQSPDDCIDAYFFCADSGACIKKLPRGSICGADGLRCLSGICSDNVCCDQICDAVCYGCTAALTGGATSDGLCGVVATGTDSKNTCPGVAACDGAGACFAKSAGVPCVDAFECTSGYCADGVCCNEACDGTCRACTAALNVGAASDGTCEATLAQADPQQECGGLGCSGAGTCRAWGTPTLVETGDAGDALGPKVAIDADGNAIAVWYQDSGTRTDIWANRYASGVGWGTAATLESDDAGDARYPEIAMNASGDAMVVWYQSDGVRFNIWARRYELNTGWGVATVIDNDNVSDARYPQVVVDPTGNAMAVWYQSDGTRNSIWANRYVAGVGWSAAAKIETDDAGHAMRPQIAIDSFGNSIATWDQSDGTRTNIWVNRYVVGEGWGTAGIIETDDAGGATLSTIAAEPSGNAVAVWQQSDGERVNIWANRFVPGTGWGGADTVATNDAGNAVEPDIAMGASGSAIAVWEQSDGTRSNIWARRYVSPTGWDTAVIIETDNVDDAWEPKIAADSEGNAIAVWSQSDGTRSNVWGNRYVAGSGWGVATSVDRTDSENAYYPDIAVNASGSAVAVWRQRDAGWSSIWASVLP